MRPARLSRHRDLVSCRSYYRVACAEMPSGSQVHHRGSQRPYRAGSDSTKCLNNVAPELPAVFQKRKRGCVTGDWVARPAPCTSMMLTVLSPGSLSQEIHMNRPYSRNPLIAPPRRPVNQSPYPLHRCNISPLRGCNISPHRFCTDATSVPVALVQHSLKDFLYQTGVFRRLGVSGRAPKLEGR